MHFTGGRKGRSRRGVKLELHSELLARYLVMEMPAMHEKVITTESDICRYVPNDREYAIKKTFMSGALALLVVAYSALASAQTVVGNAAQSDTRTAEASFMTENQAAMSKMMKDMTVKPSGTVDADFTAMMIAHQQGA